MVFRNNKYPTVMLFRFKITKQPISITLKARKVLNKIVVTCCKFTFLIFVGILKIQIQ